MPKLDAAILRIDTLAVLGNEYSEDPFVAFMDVTFHDGFSARIGLSREALIELRHALVDAEIPPAIARTVGNH